MSRFFLCAVIASSALLAGCGHRYVAFRSTNPVIEDRVRLGPSERVKMSVVSTRADRRTILIVDQNKICAEPPPDVAEAVASQTVARLSTQSIGAGFGTSLQTALLQLAQRSQGLEYFRTASFVYCNMFVINRSITPDQYNWYMAQAAAEAVKLIALQIEKNNLPGPLAGIQVTNAQTISVDADRLNKEKNPAPAPVPTPAAEPNKNPVPGPDGAPVPQPVGG